jgi:hypothetical protein
LLPILLGLVVSAGCSQRASNEFGSPESATYGALDALANLRAEPDAAWAFLDEDTRQELEARAERARDRGVDVSHPLELVRVGHLPGRADIRQIERVRVTSSRAELKLHTYLDEQFPFVLQRDGSRWTISLLDG